MDKRYQVFVSSTFNDLIDERQNVYQALLELDCIPAGMELFSASDADQWGLIKEVIDDCDYYILIIGGRYGTTTAAGISFTEKEFDYAISTSIPILAFLHQNPDEIPSGKTDIDADAQEKLRSFRRKAETGRLCKYWTSPEDLGGKVSRGVIKAIKKNPAEGWVRGKFAASSELLSQINELRDTNEKLRSNLSSIGEASPEGVEKYAGGSDPIEISGTMEVGEDKTTEDWSTTVTWDDIFSLIGPIMYEDCAESVMKKQLQNYFLAQEKNHADAVVKGLVVGEDSFQTIKVQLLALGLIMIGGKQEMPGHGNTNWKLTPYGESYAMKLKAIKVEDMKSKAIKKLS